MKIRFKIKPEFLKEKPISFRDLRTGWECNGYEFTGNEFFGDYPRITHEDIATGQTNIDGKIYSIKIKTDHVVFVDEEGNDLPESIKPYDEEPETIIETIDDFFGGIDSDSNLSDSKTEAIIAIASALEANARALEALAKIVSIDVMLKISNKD